MEFKMKLAIGFITYGEHTAKYLPYFLPSLFKALAGLEDYKIFCWDNSEDNKNNVEFIANTYPQVEITESGKNIGFAAAYNKMMGKAGKSGAEYFLVINPDTVLAPEAIKELIGIMDKDKTSGSASPKVLKWDFDGSRETNIIDTCGVKLKAGLKFVDLGQGEIDKGQHDKAEILGPSGAAGIYRMSALERITSPLAPLLGRRGGLKGRAGQYFDERMFMYKEDCDLAYRLKLAGFKARLVSKAIIYHDRTVSSAGKGFRALFRGRKARKRQEKERSFLNQHIIFLKYWHLQGFLGKLVIILRILAMFIYVLLFEQYLLGQYGKLRLIKGKIDKF
ncbi:MAG: glycosyltransferase family 2 protein [Patescibacteria group bacterium]|nr:glycosyltransferase family 2 protein [Patescibacteria group bacterium]MDD5294724.1 glycosyltransferase family 2 protein [Patescibacteria group bacterium]MDD5554960.1 glycosyltransferase family 2 protein [Patescibacteria group bacterium]